jgi:hypothetical protein
MQIPLGGQRLPDAPHGRPGLERLGGDETPFNIRDEINELSLKVTQKSPKY